MAIEVTHKIDASDLANQISEGVRSGLSSFSQALEKLVSSVPVKTSGGRLVNPRIRNSGGIQAGNNTEKLSANISTLTTQITQLNNALMNSIQAQKEMISAAKGGDKLSGIATLPAGERAKVIAEIEQFEKSQRAQKLEAARDRAEMYENRRNEKRINNIGRGLLSGVGMAALYQASNWGQVAGSQAQSVNAGANNYNQFLNQFYGSTLDTQKSVTSMGIMGAVGAAGALATGGLGLPVVLAAGAAGGVANYLMGKDTEEAKAANQLAFNQDLTSYKLRAYGISNLSSESMIAQGGIFSDGIKVPLTELQSHMNKNEKLSGYVPNIEEAMSSSRLDVVKNMSTEQQGKYIRDVSRLALITNSSIGETASAASQYAAATNESGDTAVNVILKHQLEYQGDMKSNIGKIVQLMQGAGLTQEQASELVGKYQYNDAMLQQTVNQQMITPTNRFLANQWADIITNQTGLTPEQFPEEMRRMSSNKNPTQKDIVLSQEMEQYFKYAGIDYRVQDIGAQSPSTPKYTNIDDIPETDAQKVMLDKISDAFKNINATTMHVSAGTVILNSLPQGLGMAGAADAFKSNLDAVKNSSLGKAVGNTVNNIGAVGQSVYSTIREEIPPIVNETLKKAQQRIKGVRQLNNSNASAKPVGLEFDNYSGASIVPAIK